MLIEEFGTTKNAAFSSIIKRLELQYVVQEISGIS